MGHPPMSEIHGVGSGGSVSKSGHFRPAADDSLPLAASTSLQIRYFCSLHWELWMLSAGLGEVSSYEEDGEDASGRIGSDFRGGD